MRWMKKSEARQETQKPKARAKSKSLSIGTRKAVPGPQIVRAWFDTVIHPLLKHLTRERQALIHLNWTWQFRPGSLEAIRPVRHYVPLSAHENFIQFVAFYPMVKKDAEEHDRLTEGLTAACSRLQSVLVNQSSLQTLYQELTSTESLRSVSGQLSMRGVDVQTASAERLLGEYFGGYPPSDNLAVLAQFIVNNTGDLPSHFTIAPFWNRFRERFVATLQSAAVRRQYTETTGIGARLRENSQMLSQRLEMVRNDLSLAHDVPPVDPSSVPRTDLPY